MFTIEGPAGCAMRLAVLAQSTSANLGIHELQLLSTPRNEKVKVSAVGSLQDVFLVEHGPAPVMSLRLLRPTGDPLGENVRCDVNRQKPLGHVEGDHIAILDPRERTA